MGISEPVFILVGAVVLSWLMIGRRDVNFRIAKLDVGAEFIVVLVLAGLLIGWVVRSVTGDNSILAIVLLAIVITGVVEVTRMF